MQMLLRMNPAAISLAHVLQRSHQIPLLRSKTLFSHQTPFGQVYYHFCAL